jgi:3'(2'), 5'-bisphosphate nucleotidase
MTDLTPIIAAVQQAADLTRRLATEAVRASSKGDASPVTIADYGAQALICRALAHHYPDHAVVAEESGSVFMTLVPPQDRARIVRELTAITGETVDESKVVAWLNHGQGRDTAGETWVIDPIDGTVGYVNGRYYALCVALMHNYVPTEAVMGLPRSPLDADGTLLFTGDGRLFASALDGSNRRQVGASSRGGDDLRLIDSFKIPHTDHALNTKIMEAAGCHPTPPELYDSQLKYGMVAAGYADVFIRLPRDIVADPHYIWDHATGAALIRAGGGQITDLAGNPLDFAQGKALPHTGFIASNNCAHDQLVAAATQVL